MKTAEEILSECTNMEGIRNWTHFDSVIKSMETYAYQFKECVQPIIRENELLKKAIKQFKQSSPDIGCKCPDNIKHGETETRRKAAEKIMNRLAYWIGPQKVVDFEHAVDLAEQYADQFKSSREPYFKHLEELQYPHREICHLCHRVVAVGFWVPNEIWKAVVHHSHLNAIHCLNCFIERADEKLIDWSKDIQFYAVSLRSHLDDIHNGKDDMILFHTPPKSEQPN